MHIHESIRRCDMCIAIYILGCLLAGCLDFGFLGFYGLSRIGAREGSRRQLSIHIHVYMWRFRD